VADGFGTTLPKRKPSTERPGKPWEVSEDNREGPVGSEDELLEAERREIQDLEKLADRLEAVKDQLAAGTPTPEPKAAAPPPSKALNAEVLGLHLEGDKVILSCRSGEELAEEVRESCYIDAEGSAEELRQLGLHYIEHRGKVLIYGDEARVLARVFGRELRHPLKRGLIDGKREEAMAVLREELRRLPDARARVVAVVVPDVSPEEAGFLKFHEELLRRMLESEDRQMVMVPVTEAAARHSPADAGSVGVTVHLGTDRTSTGLSFAGIVGKRWGLALGVGDVLEKASALTSVPAEELRHVLSIEGEGQGSEVMRTAAQVFLGELLEKVAGRLAEEVKSGWPERSPGVVRLCGEGACLAGVAELMKKALEQAGLEDIFGEVELLPDPELAAARGAVLLAEAESKKRAGG